MLYFKSISKTDFGGFLNAVRSRTDEERLDDLVSQAHINAKICEKKYIWLKRGIAIESAGIASLAMLAAIGAMW